MGARDVATAMEGASAIRLTADCWRLEMGGQISGFWFLVSGFWLAPPLRYSEQPHDTPRPRLFVGREGAPLGSFA